MRVLRSALALLALAAGVLAGGAALPSAAQAQTAGSCSGSVTFSQTVSGPGGTIGELIVYYKSSNGGENTACMYHRGRSVGVKSLTEAHIEACRETSGRGQPGCTVLAVPKPMTDNGPPPYGQFAGPVQVKGVQDRCVYASGWLDYAGTRYRVQPLGRMGCPP
jgi:hypothetical protein